jgi:replication factor C small subunit
MHEIWTERYRPKEFSDVVGQEHVINTISAFVDSKQIPHLLFAGPAGTGKSSVALIIARKIYGDNWKNNFLEFNASDERGINIIRTKVKDFARTRNIGNFPFKIIFLDEADALTPEAQNALRRTMENYSNTCRFFLSCNYSSKIIEPLQSRCAVFRFKTISDNDVKKRLEHIAKIEKVKISEKALEVIARLSNGDVRRAINILQASAINSKNISEDTVYDIMAIAQPEEVKKMIELSLKGKFKEAREILNDLLFKKGIAGEDIIKQIAGQIYDLDLPEKTKLSLIEKVGDFEFRLDQGGDPQIQLEALLAQFAK